MARYEQLSVSSRESQGRPAGDGEGLANVEFTIGAESTNVINVAIQAKRHKGGDCQVPVVMPWYFADDAAGLNPTTTAHDGGTAIGTDGALIENVANLSGKMVTEADGDCDIDITDAGVFTVYLVIVLPSGELAISGAITHA